MGKNKSLMAKRALKKVADMHGLSVEEVEKEIEKALKMAGSNESALSAVGRLSDEAKDKLSKSQK